MKLAPGLAAAVGVHGNHACLSSLRRGWLATLEQPAAIDALTHLAEISTMPKGLEPAWVSSSKAADSVTRAALAALCGGYQWHLPRKPPSGLLTHLLSVWVKHRIFRAEVGLSRPVPVCVAARFLQLAAMGKGSMGVVTQQELTLAAATRLHPRARILNGTAITQGVPSSLAGSLGLLVMDIPARAGSFRTWLDRAALLTRPGALVSVLVHPAHRADLSTALAPLPLDVEQRMYEHTALALPCLVELPQRLDHVLLRRKDRPGAVSEPDQALDDQEAAPGTPVHDVHGCQDLTVAQSSHLTAQDLLRIVPEALALAGAAHTPLQTQSAHGFDRLFCAFGTGGHLTVSREQATGRTAVDMFPFHATALEALAHLCLVCAQRHAADTGSRIGVTSQR